MGRSTVLSLSLQIVFLALSLGKKEIRVLKRSLYELDTEVASSIAIGSICCPQMELLRRRSK